MTDFTATRSFTYVDGAIIDPDENNVNENTLYNKYNAAMHDATGHGHTGATGDAPILSITAATSGTLTIARGGTTATTEAAARTNLQLANSYGWFYNIAIIRATTTNAGDSVKITSAGGTAFSASNVGRILLRSTVTAGQMVEFSITADVTLLLSGITPTINGTGDVTGALLRILAINDNGTLKWGAAYLGGRTTLLTTDTSATQANITDPEDVLCTSAVASALNTCEEIGYVRADFTDATNIWAVQSGINDCVTGRNADGLSQPFNTTFGGWSANPVFTCTFMQEGRRIFIRTVRNSGGTSNSTTSQMTFPAKARISGALLSGGAIVDNGVALTTPGLIDLTLASTTAVVYRDMNATNWTAAGSKYFNIIASYEVGPAASFIE